MVCSTSSVLAAQPGAPVRANCITAPKISASSRFAPSKAHTGTSSVLWNTNGISAQCHGVLFSHQREILIKQITVHLSARLGTLPDIFDRGGAEAGICQQQVFLRAVRVGSTELLPQGLCGKQTHCFLRADSFQTIKETVELRINRTDQHRDVCGLGPKPTAVMERISKIEAVRVGTLAHVRAFAFRAGLTFR